eukprot:8035285-Heterocapsa_arctica.AAC.1
MAEREDQLQVAVEGQLAVPDEERVLVFLHHPLTVHRIPCRAVHGCPAVNGDGTVDQSLQLILT